LISALSHGFGRAKLVAEGREVIFEVRQAKPLVYRIVPFVNGEFRHKWALPDTFFNDVDRRTPRQTEPDDETDRFAQRLMRPRVSKVYGPTRLKELNKIYRKAGLDPITKEKNEARYLDVWHCPKALVRHLEREFESIEILEPEDAAA
jgi:hypothetical protein